MDTNLNHQCGRPSKTEQLKIKNEIWTYFTQSLGPEIVSQITGHNIKTVRKYYKKFYSVINTNKEKDYVKEWQMIKKKTGFALELQLAEQLEVQNSLKKQFKAYEDNGEQVPVWLYKERRKMSESIRVMMLSLSNFALYPTADITLKNQTQEVLQKHGMV